LQQAVEHLNAVANPTLCPLADSWYFGSTIAGEPRVCMPYAGGHNYREQCEEIVKDGFRG